MSIIHVDDGGSNTSPYETWAKAATTLQVALDAWASGDVIYVHTGPSGPHSETYSSSQTLSSSAADTIEDPILVYGVDMNASEAPIENPAVVTFEVTATPSTNDLAITAQAVWHGLFLSVADGADDFNLALADTIFHFYACRLKCGNTAGDDFNLSSISSDYSFEKCILDIGDQITSHAGIVRFKDCVVTIGDSTNMTTSSSHKSAVYDGCDFSGNTDGDTIVSGNTGRPVDYLFKNCKMTATWTGSSVIFYDYQSAVRFHNCDDANDFPRHEIYEKAGDTKTDTGVFVTSGNWSDETANATGVPLSFKMTPSDEVHAGGYLESLPIRAYVASTGSKTFTVELIDDFENALQNDEAALYISFYPTSGQAEHDIANSRLVLGDTPANLTSGIGTASWTAEPASSRSVRMAVTATVNNIGFYEATVRLFKHEANGADGNPGAALYVAPLLAIT